MISIAEKSLLLAMLGSLAISTHADSLVTAPYPYSKIDGGGFGCCYTTAYFFAPEEFHSSQEVRTRSPLRNRIDWQFSERNDTFERLNIEADAYSVFIPEHDEYRCGRDGTCGFVFVPDYYDDSTVSGHIPLELSQPLFVTVIVEVESLHGAPYFQLDYFDRLAFYATDVSSGELSPLTTMMPNLATADPLDVLPFTDRFWASAGSHMIEFEIMSGFLERGQLFDAAARITVQFSTVPEPTTLMLIAVAGLALVCHSRIHPPPRTR